MSPSRVCRFQYKESMELPSTLYSSCFTFMYLFYRVQNMLLSINIFISINDVSHTSFGNFADKQAGKNIRDICSLQMTS
jgi:hypothetical protein